MRGMNDKDRFAKLLDTLARLVEENEEVPVIVEGRRDVESLRALGAGGELIPLHTGGTLVEFCETLGRRTERAILLLDWDREGRELHETVRRSLTLAGVEVDDTFRESLKRWVNAQLKDVESLAPYIERGRRKFNL
jgi:2,5-diamino-6-(ribosylamino)-4(3H)-pyrimidinone 5'-phosphate reductase